MVIFPTALAVRDCWKPRHVVLTHLSRENNLPSLAHQCVKNTLLAGHLTGSIKLWVADALGASANIQI